jgi:DNA mismatch repair protein MutS
MNIERVCNILNILCTRKNKTISQISLSNPKFSGFTMSALDKYLRILQENDWTTVLIEQVTPPPKPKREVTQIISPGTYLDMINDNQSNFVFSIYVEKLKQFKSNIYLNQVGLSAIDVTTGKIYVYETCDTLTDKTLAAHETYRFIHSHSSNPKEIVLNFSNNEKDEEFLNCLGLKQYYINQWKNDEMNKISYQNKLFDKYYSSEIMTPIESINLEQHPQAVISLCVLFQYIYDHNPKLLTRINKPEYWDLNQHLLLSHDAYQQLNLYVPNDSAKFLSVFDVINQTSTPMGTRLLRDRLLNPLTSIQKLKQRYDQIDSYKNKTNLLKNLKQIVDLERFHRRLLLGKLHPMEFVKLIQSYEIVLEISKKDNKTIFKTIKQKLEEYEKLFNYDLMATCKLDQMINNFFNSGIYPEIDSLVKQKQENEDELNNMRKVLIDKLVQVDSKTKYSDDLVKLIKTDKEGYHLTMTKLRYKKIEKFFNYEGKIMASSIKLSNKTIRKINNKLDELLKQISEKLLEYFVLFSTQVDSEILEQIHDYVATLDVNLSCAHVSNIYGYNRPELIEDESSWVKCKDMRHPLIERIHTTENYVTNDVALGKEEKGMIITGMNSVGKSSLEKSVGVNIVLAQAGMYVACSQMKLSPFKTILTRIEGNDNLIKGQSSFMVEMMELKTILERSSVNSLVLGDEICRGTEQLSGISILSASIIDLSTRNVPFIYTTHLHKIKDIPQVQELDNLGYYFMKMDITNDGITINRKLQKGFCDSLYGIEVARFILDKPDFIQQAFKIRNFLLEEHQEIVSPKKSRYNKDVYMDRCQIDGCNETKNLHTHHIKHQEDANEYNLNEGFIRKNQKSNLIVLCEKHHQEIHN